MSRSGYPLLVLLAALAMFVLVLTADRTDAAPILEPDFTKAPVGPGNFNLCARFTGQQKKCAPGQTVNFSVVGPPRLRMATVEAGG